MSLAFRRTMNSVVDTNYCLHFPVWLAWISVFIWKTSQEWIKGLSATVFPNHCATAHRCAFYYIFVWLCAMCRGSRSLGNTDLRDYAVLILVEPPLAAQPNFNQALAVELVWLYCTSIVIYYSKYTEEFIVDWMTTRCPGLVAAKQAEIITPPTPCLTVGM